MKTLYALLLSLFVGKISAQIQSTPINFDAIEAAIRDSSSENYYPSLVNRFNQFDTSLTDYQYKLLYYGFGYQKNYDANADHKKREINELLKSEKFYAVTQVCDSVLEEIPISLTANYYKGFALFNISQYDPMCLMYRNRYLRLRDAIISTGNGLSCETAFKTLFLIDEYEVVFNHFKVEKVSAQARGTTCDKLIIQPNEKFKSPEIFFHTSEGVVSMKQP